jgi:hypothetical protein
MKPKRPKEVIDADQQIREYYEHQSPSESEAFREPMESVPTRAQRAGKLDGSDERTARLSGGDPDVSPQSIDAGTETPGGSNPTPDQDLVDEIGEAVGVTYQENEPLKFGDKYAARDDSRWELNPASSEDYQERQQSEAKPVRPRSPSSKKTGGPQSTEM